MATSGRFRLPGQLDTFRLEGNPTNYKIVSTTSGSTVATYSNGSFQSNSNDISFNRNLANNGFSQALQTPLRNLTPTNTAANQNAAKINPNPAQSTAGGTSSASTSASPNTQSNSNNKPQLFTYPSDRNVKQDYIEFKIYKLKKNSQIQPEKLAESLQRSDTTGIKGNLRYYDPIGTTINLPIQASITDQNTANWGSGELNELQRMFAEASAKAMTSGNRIANAFGDLTSGIYDQIEKNQGQFSNLLYVALLEQAVNAPGLLSRITGGVLNPNMELLFQGPTLRPFNFTFKMSPRSVTEANSVRNIIRAFKKNMAPKVNNIFLEAPNVFQIRYVHGTKDRTHESINLIKVCSLLNCSVDYTPLGTYMTYEDEDPSGSSAIDEKASMVSYSMTLSFSEIDPIYQQDYDDKHSIGF